MKNIFPLIKPMGERSILIEFKPEIAEENLENLLFYKNLVEEHYDEVTVEVINTYSSLLIYYVDAIENLYSEVSAVEGLFRRANIGKKNSKEVYHLPVCYDTEFGLDLEVISRANGLSIPQIIDLHTRPFYTVYFIGFLPGFLYLGGLDPKLHISRKNAPRLKVEKGAVGIGEKQTGIYPEMSPGGWQIIGNSPVPLFDKNSLPPSPVSAGDKVKFFSVSKEEFLSIQEEVNTGNYHLKKEKYEG